MAIDLSNPELQTAWKELTQHNSKTNWILFSFEDNTNKLKLAAQGSGGVDELKQQLDDSQVQFGAFRVVGVDNRETTVSRRPKFIWFTYIGSKVSVLKKARVSVMKPEVSQFFNSAVTNLEISKPDDLDKIEISRRLIGIGGAHKPTHYEFAHNDNISIDQL